MKLLPLALVMLGTVFPLATSANGLTGFVRDVFANIAANVISDVVKDWGTAKAVPPKVDQGTNDDKAKVTKLLASLSNTNRPLQERIEMYAPAVDYFSAGVVDHDFIRKDRERFEKRWPIRDYQVLSIDELAVAPDRKFAIARYTVKFIVTRPDAMRQGTSKVAVLIGSFDSTPKIHSIKEWVSTR